LTEERTIRLKVENETALIWCLIVIVLLLLLALLLIYCCCRNTKQVTLLDPEILKPGPPEMALVKRPSPKKKRGLILKGPPMKPKPARPLNVASGIPDSLTDWSSLSQDEPDPDVTPMPPKKPGIKPPIIGGDFRIPIPVIH
jgi:hypothetical protein